MAISIPTSDLDLYSDEVLAEPYEHYRRLREAGPAVWLERHDAWVNYALRYCPYCAERLEDVLACRGCSTQRYA
jgi:hypothetical protein